MKDFMEYGQTDLFNIQDEDKKSENVKEDINQNIEEEPIKDEDLIITEKSEVIVDYMGETYVGRVTRIYNNGDTFNVSFNGMNTAFFKSKIKKA